MNPDFKAGFVWLAFMTLYAMGLKAQSSCNCKVPIDSTFQVAPMTVGMDTDIGVPPLYENDNATTPAIALPFHFCFYGQSYDTIYISNNGIISFQQPIHAFIDSTQTFPLGHDTAIIAPFYADANTNRNSGVVYYQLTSTHLIVVWDSVRYVGTDVDGWNYFQLIITDGNDPIIDSGNNISFCYPIMQWAVSDASGGFSGYNGTPSFTGLNKGDGITYTQIDRIQLPGFYYYGPFSGFNCVDWLDFKSFTLSSCVSGSAIPPVILDNNPDCHTLYICPCDTSHAETPFGEGIANCDTITMTASFICTGPGQSASLSYSLSGPMNILSIDTSTANIIDSITILAIPVFSDSGEVKVRLTATDSAGNLQSTVIYTVDVTTACKDSQATTSNILGAEINSGLSIYPNPADKYFTISIKHKSPKLIYKIYSAIGAELFSGNLNENLSKIDVSRFARGIYFVTVEGEQIAPVVRKFILE